MDAAAELRELYGLYAARIYTYCVRVTGSAEDAADALQDTFTSVYVRLESGSGRPVEHPRAYLFAVARRACLRRLEERRRVEVVSEPPEPPDTSSYTAAETDVLTRAVQEDVRAANLRLPVRQREVLVLREVEQLSYVEIGELMQLEPNAAAQLAWRARLGLRAALRQRALASIAPKSKDCERALMLLALAEDAPLAEEDATWVDEHLEDCPRCTANRAAMLEAGVTYRSWTPIAAAPLAAALVAERAEASVGGPRHPHRTSALAGTATVVLVTVGALVFAADEVADPGAPPAAVQGAAASTQAPVTGSAAQKRSEQRSAKRAQRGARSDAATSGAGGGAAATVFAAAQLAGGTPASGGGPERSGSGEQPAGGGDDGPEGPAARGRDRPRGDRSAPLPDLPTVPDLPAPYVPTAVTLPGAPPPLDLVLPTVDPPDLPDVGDATPPGVSIDVTPPGRPTGPPGEQG